MRSAAIPRSWLFMLSVAVALTGCSAPGAKPGAGAAAPASLELTVGYGSERPAEARGGCCRSGLAGAQGGLRLRAAGRAAVPGARRERGRDSGYQGDRVSAE